jgi:hypothetical protein
LYKFVIPGIGFLFRLTDRPTWVLAVQRAFIADIAEGGIRASAVKAQIAPLIGKSVAAAVAVMVAIRGTHKLNFPKMKEGRLSDNDPLVDRSMAAS